MELHGKSLVAGIASGKVLHSDTPLSFWGGIDPQTGIIIDEHHPSCGHSVTGSVLCLPSGRGSCTGSMLMLELLLTGTAPSALILGHQDEILALGVLAASIVFNVSIPVLVLSNSDFARLAKVDFAYIYDARISTQPQGLESLQLPQNADFMRVEEVELSPDDEAALRGQKGLATKLAMELVLSFAILQGAKKLIDISRAHIDSCIYTGPASLAFPEKLLSLGAKVAVPTTINAISIDTRRWRELGMEPAQAKQAGTLANAYVAMGAQSTFTCAPYSLPNPPSAGDQLGWGESNAVIFANSVLGARTQKYPDLLEVCVALTGRAPLAGCHTDEGRQPMISIKLPVLPNPHDAQYAALGYLAGSVARNRIPIIHGLEHLEPSMADLKAFAAAVGTSSSTPMFHIVGITPEADQYNAIRDSIPEVALDEKALERTIASLNTAKDPSVGLISLGNPHFMLEEFRCLAGLCLNRHKCTTTSVIVTTSQDTYSNAAAAGYISAIETFGAQVITDTCWCMISEPVVPPHIKNLATNSAKYAHYAPGLVKRGVHFGSLAQCVEAACTGMFERDLEADRD